MCGSISYLLEAGLFCGGDGAMRTFKVVMDFVCDICSRILTKRASVLIWVGHSLG